MISNSCITLLYTTIAANNAHKYIKISYIHYDLLHVLANHVAIFRVVKYVGGIHKQSTHKILYLWLGSIYMCGLVMILQ